MSIGRKGTGTVAALAAALVLVLQSVFGAIAAGGPVQRDIFGNAICVGGEARHNPANGHDGGHLPDCCTLGCGTSTQLLASAPGDAKNLLLSPEFVAVALSPLPATPALDDPGRQPGNPRAPPFAA